MYVAMLLTDWYVTLCLLNIIESLSFNLLSQERGLETSNLWPCRPRFRRLYRSFRSGDVDACGIWMGLYIVVHLEPPCARSAPRQVSHLLFVYSLVLTKIVRFGDL